MKKSSRIIAAISITLLFFSCATTEAVSQNDETPVIEFADETEQTNKTAPADADEDFTIIFHGGEKEYKPEDQYNDYEIEETDFDAEEIPAAEHVSESEEISEPEEIIPPRPQYLSRNLRGTGRLTAAQLAYYFCQMNPEADIIHIINFAFYYIQEAGEEGINSDVAFAQMCLETGYLRFGNLVQPEFHNYCGLGAMDIDHPGEIFETERLGVRAHIQHLHAYATHEDELLNNELVDPRYSWVHKTKYVETIEGLTGTWATDPRYAEKIESNLQNMENLFEDKLK